MRSFKKKCGTFLNDEVDSPSKATKSKPYSEVLGYKLRHWFLETLVLREKERNICNFAPTYQIFSLHKLGPIHVLDAMFDL